MREALIATIGRSQVRFRVEGASFERTYRAAEALAREVNDRDSVHEDARQLTKDTSIRIPVHEAHDTVGSTSYTVGDSSYTSILRGFYRAAQALAREIEDGDGVHEDARQLQRLGVCEAAPVQVIEVLVVQPLPEISFEHDISCFTRLVALPSPVGSTPLRGRDI